jgi:hypothetical protein
MNLTPDIDETDDEAMADWWLDENNFEATDEPPDPDISTDMNYAAEEIDEMFYLYH